MARKSIEQRLAELDAKRTALVARKNKLDRSADTRRKVLLGAFLLHRLDNKPNDETVKLVSSWLRRELPGFLVRDGDKPLFTSFLTSGEMDGAAVKETRGEVSEEKTDRAISNDA